MRAIILAAGMGRRMASSGSKKPKCLLQVGGRSLLDHMLDAIRRRGLAETVIVDGHQRESVEAAARNHAMPCRFVLNEDYAHTNTIHSLWRARDFLSESFLLCNADVWFDARILDLLLDRRDSALAVDAGTCGPEAVKVITDERGMITRIGKSLPSAGCFGEFIGIAKFEQSVCPSLIESLRYFNEELGQKNLFFESALDAILAHHRFEAVPIGALPAVEIDTPQDYERAQSTAEAAGASSNLP